MIIQKLTSCFLKIFKCEPEHFFFAPGRINLIGEHIDYNGGLVFPSAISKGTYAAVSLRKDQTFQLYSVNFTEIGVHILNPSNLTYDKKDGWTNYVKGVLAILLEKIKPLPFGLNIVIYGNLPNGAGLSSSASLELLICKILDTYYSLNLSPIQMALIGKQVENQYIGVNSGIMDQFAIALGQKDQALLLNCATQAYQYIPFNLGNYRLVIMNTNKRRELSDSKYNERFAQCQSALEKLRPHFGISHLCELSDDKLPQIKQLLDQPLLYQRVKHVITENTRVHQAVTALYSNDFLKFGQLLNASHTSLKDDYEVTGIELDTLVNAALKNGAIGARMTGAGFGGCALCLVEKDKSQSLIDKTSEIYEKAIGYKASFYEAFTSDGPICLS